ncbi:MAG: SurA N-terminal domain-containing protein, partial [Planctomycetales bacterium]|nr:SurA N-terminal domain-containing protein [Planctomycetales bacterium]
MASPFSYFRKYQYLMLVGFGVMLMFAFVVLPPLQQWLQSMQQSVHDPVVVKWDYGRLRQSDIQRMQYEHNVLHNFLNAVRQKTVEKQGAPTRPKVEALERGGEQRVLANLLLAKKASLQGIRVNDAAITHYLDEFSDGVLTKSEYRELFEKSQLSQGALYKQLRTELLAQNMRRLLMSALPKPTPADVWKAHDRLARHVELEVLAIPVEEFVSSVKDEPSTAELKELFEAGKTRAPLEMSPEPGFYILPKAKFQYLKGDFAKYLAEAKESVTEEEIKARYESGIKLREFRKEPGADNPPADNTPSDNPPADNTPADNKPADNKPADNKPADNKPADNPPADNTPADNTPADNTPADNTPA